LEVFSTGTEKKNNLGFSGIVRHTGRDNGARFGRIFFQLSFGGIAGCQEMKTGLEKEDIPC
jgi:hypothetical protein